MRLFSEERISFVVFAVVIALLLTHHLIEGPKASPDFKAFDQWSTILLESHFDYQKFWVSPRIGFPERLYTCSVTLIAFLKMLAPESWTVVYFHLNLAFMAMTLFLFYLSARLLWIRHAAIAATLPLFLISSDFLFWPRYLLTDMSFAFLVTLNLYLSLKIWSGFRQRLMASSLTLVLVHALLLVLMLFSRPASLPYVAAFLVFHSLAYLNLQRTSQYVQASVLAAVVAATAVLFGHIMEGHATGQIPGFREINYLGRYAHEGVVIIHRPETYLDIGSSVWDYARLFLVRVTSFYSPYASQFSLAHQLFNFALHGTVAGAIVFWFFSRAPVSDLVRRASLLILLLCVAAVLFHSVTIIDYDWRYRFPVVTPLLLIVAQVAQQLLPGHQRQAG